jgi:photosystem II biogenesis protein Psp29
VNNPLTVSDTKRSFYSIHTRPINSIYRRVIEELLVEIHLLKVNEDFKYDPAFALGIVTTFDRFMQGYTPEADRPAIFEALAAAEGYTGAQLRSDAEQLKQACAGKSTAELLTDIEREALQGSFAPTQVWHNIASNSKFKYSRLFAIGLYTLLEQADPELVKNETSLNESLQKLSTILHLPGDKLQKDLELYRSNLEKMVQARKTLDDIVAAERRRREQQEAAKAAAVNDNASDNASAPSDPPSASESTNG